MKNDPWVHFAALELYQFALRTYDLLTQAELASGKTLASQAQLNAEQRKKGPKTPLLISGILTHAAKRSALPHGPSSPPKVLLWTNQAAELGSYAQPKNDGEQ